MNVTRIDTLLLFSAVVFRLSVARFNGEEFLLFTKYREGIMVMTFKMLV